MNLPITKYHDVKHITTKEYFENNDFSVDAFNKKYAENKDETYLASIWRACQFVASVEKTPTLQKYWAERWFDEVYNDWWHPAGSIMQGAGSGKKISLANCTHASLGGNDLHKEWDSLESIIKNTGYTVAKEAAYRQGLGVDFSRLRPRGTTVDNSAKESTGSIHWMQWIDLIGKFVGQKGRIPAMLFSLNIKHPDIEEFITVKSDRTKIQNANISCQITNDFYKAVIENKKWLLEFTIPAVKKGDRSYIDRDSAKRDTLKDRKGYYNVATHDKKKEHFTKEVDARKLLMLVAEQMRTNAEPGIQNIDIAKKYSNSDYVYDPKDSYDSRIIGSNACSEQYLSRDSLCVLASINAGRFSADYTIFEKEMSIIAPSMNRFLDNVNECELVYKTYATPVQKEAIEKLRRTGGGFTNLCEWLLKKKLAYGTPEGNDASAKFAERMNYYMYKNSIELGKEKGSFKLFNRKKYEQSPFIKRMMGLGLVFTHMRNVTCSSIAPTGTLSLMFRGLIMSYGIEPSFGMYFWKRTRISGEYKYYFCVPSAVRKMFTEAGIDLEMKSDSIEDNWDGSIGIKIAKTIEENKDKLYIKFKRDADISAFDKLDLMAKVMKWIDSSISVTYNLPENSTTEDVFNFILKAYETEVKSIAAFPDKKMYGIVTVIPFKELAIKLGKEGLVIDKQNFNNEEQKQLEELGTILSDNQSILKTKAPKRPSNLKADVHHIKIKGEDHYVVVGMFDAEDPYEIFSGKNVIDGVLVIPKHIKEGIVTKKTRGEYILKSEELEIILSSKEISPTANALSRMISTALRHGADISFIVHQLEKTEGDMQSFAKVVARALKKYIKEGSKVHGEGCPKCGNTNLFRHDGCIYCHCGWSPGCG